jgi:hypothetical protein
METEERTSAEASMVESLEAGEAAEEAAEEEVAAEEAAKVEAAAAAVEALAAIPVALTLAAATWAGVVSSLSGDPLPDATASSARARRECSWDSV